MMGECKYFRENCAAYIDGTYIPLWFVFGANAYYYMLFKIINYFGVTACTKYINQNSRHTG